MALMREGSSRPLEQLGQILGERHEALAFGSGDLRRLRLGCLLEQRLKRQADLVLLLNPDTVVQPGAIEALHAFLQAHPRVGAVGPRLLNPDGSVQARLADFTTGGLRARVETRRGQTPYLRLGDLPILLASLLVLALAIWRRLRG